MFLCYCLLSLLLVSVAIAPTSAEQIGEGSRGPPAGGKALVVRACSCASVSLRERVRWMRERVRCMRERVLRERVWPSGANGCPGCGGYVLGYLRPRA